MFIQPFEIFGSDRMHYSITHIQKYAYKCLYIPISTWLTINNHFDYSADDVVVVIDIWPNEEDRLLSSSCHFFLFLFIYAAFILISFTQNS